MKPFDFELMIGGLCMLHFDKIPDPKECRVLLVNATRQIDMFRGVPSTESPHLHFPRLSVSGRNLVHDPRERRPSRSVTDSSGEDFGIFEIDLEALTLTVNGASALRVDFQRAAKQQKKPGKNDMSWLDWTCGIRGSSFTDPRIASLHPDCLKNPAKGGPVIASLHSRVGDLRTHEVSGRGAFNQLLQFEPWKTGASPQAVPHCLADRLLLSIGGIDRRDRVVIQSSAGSIVLGPERGRPGKQTVRAALTNLHEIYHPPRPAIYDFAWFYSMVEWQGGIRPPTSSLIIPSVAEGEYTPSSGLCPPAFWG